MNDEQIIIERAKAGDSKAFDELVKRHQREVHLLALRLIGENEEALDVSQQAFIQAYKGLKNFRGDSAFSTWMYRITYNTAMKKLKYAKWKRFVPAGDSYLEDRPGTDNPHREAERNNFRDELSEAIDNLPPQMKAVFTLHQVQGLKMAEVADIMGKSEGNIKALHYHAVRKLRESLQEWKHAEFSA